VASSRPVVLIGTTCEVGWDEAATYVGGFYAALLRRRFATQPTRRRAAFLDAHQRAAHAYRTLREESPPFRALELRR
jgi:hypothetical protein